MVIFHGYVSHNQMVDSPNGGFTAFFSKIQGVAWGKLLRENPGSKTIKNHPFSVFPEKIPLGSCSVQFLDTTVWKIWNCLPILPIFYVSTSLFPPALLIHRSGGWRVSPRGTAHVKIMQDPRGERNAKIWEWNDNAQYNTWRVALLDDTRLVKIIQNPAKMLKPLFQRSEWHKAFFNCSPQKHSGQVKSCPPLLCGSS